MPDHINQELTDVVAELIICYNERINHLKLGLQEAKEWDLDSKEMILAIWRSELEESV